MANFTSPAMDNFCGSSFWIYDLTWNTTNPYFTKCFEKTVLVWIQCFFLWLFSPIEVYYLLTSTKRNVPWNWVNQSKLAITAGLMILMIADIWTAFNAVESDSRVPSVNIYSPLIKLLSLALSGLLVYYNKRHGLHTSGLLFLFWFMMLLFGIPQFRSEINSAHNNTSELYTSSIIYLIYFPCVIIMFLLNCLADKPALESKYFKTDNPSPEQSASFLSHLLFLWFDKLALTGFRRPLEQKDLWDMNPEDSSRDLVPKFEKHWLKTLQKCNSLPLQQTEAKFKSDSGHIDFVHKPKKKQASILPAIFKCFGSMYLLGVLMKLVQDLLMFVSPQILGLMIKFVADLSAPIWKGYFYAFLLFFTASVQTLVLAQYFNRMFIIGMRIRSVLVAIIYKKALKISNAARKESTVGEIVNLMAVDAQRFMDLVGYINMIWSAPLQIILSLYFLWQELGPSVLAGLAVMIILIPVNGFIANKVKSLQIKQMKNKDERVKLMNEILSGIKVLKLYAWEPSFENQVLKIRNKEINVLKQAAYLNAGTSFIWSCAPFLVILATFVTFIFSSEQNILTPENVFKSMSLFALMSMPMGLLPLLIVFTVEVSLVTFATYVLVDENNILDANKAYVSISLFNIIRFPLSMLPMMISNLIQTYVSVTRINKFMNADELDPNNVQHEANQEYPLTIEGGNFSWGEDAILKDINMQLRKGTLTAVVGTVGSGKSSLISAFLGEMNKLSGKVNTYGTVAYVSQQAWIQNATLKDNILFGQPLNTELYEKVIEACALKPDLEILPGGDMTEIGEKGINLSGGQKQRVSLARAVYANADIYFLDDPLSAVDSHVGKHIFDKVIGPKGILKNKTKVLVTHGITYLPQTEHILVIKDGQVSESGTYRELLDKKGAFAEFLLQHISEDNNDDLDELKDTLIDSPISDEVAKRLTRHRSRVSESHSESGSDHIRNGSIQRQKSTESSAEKTLRKTSKDEVQNGPKTVKQGQQLIETEKAETGNVSWAVYKHYLQSIGFFLMFATLLLNLVYQGFSVGSNVWLGVWADDHEMYDNGTVNKGKRDMYLGVYGALGVGQVVTTLLASLSLYLGTLNAAKLLHRRILFNIMRVPVTTFFDVTPLGRVLNRFSKDIDTLDNVLPMTLRGWVSCLYSFRGLPLTHPAEMSQLTIETGNNTAILSVYQIISREEIGHQILSLAPGRYSVALSAFFCDLSVYLGGVTAAIVLHQALLHGILHSPMIFFDTQPIGRILSRFSSDVESVDDELPWYFGEGTSCFFEVIGTLAVISYTTPLFIVVIIPIGVLYYFIQRFYVATSRQLKRLESVSRSPIYSHFSETITGVQAIRAFAQQERFTKESERKVDLNQVCYYPGIISNRWLAVRLEMIGNLIIFFAALFAVLSKGPGMSAGLVGLSITYSLQITQTLNWLVRMTSDVETNIVAVERIKEYADAPQEAPWEIPNKNPSKEWPEQGSVKFSNYAVRYRPELDLILKGVNFDIKGGEKVGIVGRTGAGKSSLTLSLFRIIEAASGQIFIDDVNISELGLHTLRSRLTIIPQDAVLFSGTLRMNLDPFNKHNDDEVWQALEHAHLKTFVKGLTAGLQHEVSEGGENLSVGQRQLICLARALLRKTKLLILDEATAAVDLETDDLIQKTIREEFKNCTVLTIAHRLNTIMDSDRIIVLDKGQIVEFDSPNSLLSNPGSIFSSMHKDAGLS